MRTVVTFHPKSGPIILVADLDEVVVLPKVAVRRGHMVATVVNLKIGAAASERGVRLILLTRRRRSDLIPSIFPGPCCRRGNTF